VAWLVALNRQRGAATARPLRQPPHVGLARLGRRLYNDPYRWWTDGPADGRPLVRAETGSFIAMPAARVAIVVAVAGQCRTGRNGREQQG